LKDPEYTTLVSIGLLLLLGLVLAKKRKS